MRSWTSEENEKLLVAIIRTSQPKIDHAAVAAYMGEIRTVYAVQHQIRKLQKLAAKDASCHENGAAVTTKKPTPKRKKPGTRQGESVGGGRKQSEDSAPSEASPTKKQKKSEPGIDDDDDDGETA